jgi:hypothetical protein
MVERLRCQPHRSTQVRNWLTIDQRSAAKPKVVRSYCWQKD